MNNTYAEHSKNSIFTSEAIHEFDIQHELDGIEKIVNKICATKKRFSVATYPFLEYYERLQFAAKTCGSLDFTQIMQSMRRDVQNDETDSVVLFWRQYMKALRYAFQDYIKPWVEMSTIERLIDIIIIAYRFDYEYFMRLKYQKKQKERQEQFLALMHHEAFESEKEQLFINSLPRSSAVQIQASGLWK